MALSGGYMKKIIKIYLKYKEIINYIIVGGLTTLVSLGVKWGLLFTILEASNGVQLQIANIISWFCAVTFAYFSNRIFVFQSKNKRIINEMFNFFSARLLTLFLESIILWFFITLLEMNSNIWVVVWTIVTQFMILVLNYIFSKIFVFKEGKKNEKNFE